jgi:multidrug efflux pump subunit AcrB
VTLALAKKSGTNAVSVVREVRDRLTSLERFLPDGVEIEVTRDAGATAARKSSTLIQSLGFAVVTVVALLALTLGWREALVVALAVPLSFSGALFVSHLLGYTINRVTMFALIVSLGLIVDDPITNVDNIRRHVRGWRGDPKEATLSAVEEVLPPVLVSTLAIVVSFAPLFFITGMMGPYMGPMAADVPLTVGFSTLFSLTVVPWVSHRLLKSKAGSSTEEEGGVPVGLHRFYRRVVGPFLDHRGHRWALFGGTFALLLAACALVLLRQVPVKMLPFDDKDELQLVLDLPEGTTLERTDAATRAFERHLRGVPEVESFVSYVGTASPMDFNGLVRHYYLREGGNVASIRVDLVEKRRREMQSHPLALRLRDELEAVAERHGVELAIVEQPPGPPVLATVVAELSGPPGTAYDELVRGQATLAEVMAREAGVTDLDASTEAEHLRLDFEIDRDRAALHGLTPRAVARALRLALSGREVAQVHAPRERQALPVRVLLSRTERSGRVSLEGIRLRAADGALVPLAELGAWVERPADQPIMHKDLEPVVMQYAEVVGRSPVTAILDLQDKVQSAGIFSGLEIDWASEGEWQITLRVFRDLGIAFGAALVGIYVLMVIQTSSFGLPLVLMLAIPLTLLGILPGFWLLNLVLGGEAGGYATPVFFTATSMIGMIALGGIVIRNSVVLLDFVENARRAGMGAREATLQSGAIRMRPILLTAATTSLGVWPITLDPIFSGLAWALIFGLVASTAFSLVLVPTAYFAVYGDEG